MVFPCKFYNTEKGCRSNEDECGHPHVLYCTNEICVKSEKQHTHTHATCGQKGGGAHTEFIAKKREISMADKAKKKAVETANVAATVSDKAVDEISKAKKTVGDILYNQVLLSLTQNNNAGYTQMMKDYPTELPVERLAGKIVGMFLEAMDLSELIRLTAYSNELSGQMLEAVSILHKHNQKVAE